MAGIIQFENVGLRYGTGGETLCDLSFTLPRGSFHFLLGPSGAGKSALLRLVTGDERPSRGFVRLFGQPLSEIPPRRMPALRRRMARITREPRLIDELSLRANLALPLRIIGQSGGTIDERVDEMLAWIGLVPRADVIAYRLSTLERQRATIARAAIAGPELILADEPTGLLDPDAAARTMALFQRLHHDGTTILFATHDVRLIGKIENATTMRLVRGRLGDPVGALRYPPARMAPA